MKSMTTSAAIAGAATLALCGLLSTPGFSQKNKPYREDLSALRPKVVARGEETAKDTVVGASPAAVAPTHAVNARVDAVLDSIDQLNLTRKFIDGFTIQIYSGQKREEAMNTKKKLQEELPDWTANLLYQQPKFRVTVGKYFSKLAAQKDLLKLKRLFSAAILVPEKVTIK